MEQWNEKRAGLSRTGIGNTDHVFTAKNMRDGAVLDRRRGRISLRDDVPLDAFVDLKIFETMFGREVFDALFNDRFVNEF